MISFLRFDSLQDLLALTFEGDCIHRGLRHSLFLPAVELKEETGGSGYEKGEGGGACSTHILQILLPLC